MPHRSSPIQPSAGSLESTSAASAGSARAVNSERRLIRFSRGRLGPAIFFSALLVLGLVIVRDYGIYIDEFTNHYFGVAWYHYVQNILFHHAPIAPLATAVEHDIIHGPVFEMALAWIEESVLHVSNLRAIVFFRHYATWLIFYFGVVCCYFIARRLWASRPLALLACLFLVIHPRIFSHALYDSVDISFLGFYTASICTLVRYLDRRTLGSLCLHAVTCALAIDIRVLGGVIPALTVGLLAIDLMASKDPARRVFPALSRIAIFVSIVALTTIAFWPYLWTNPVLRALDVIRTTPKINWNGLVFYFGHDTVAPQLPWHYIPVWILITTPIACSVFFFIGLFEVLWATVRHPVACYRARVNDLVVAAAVLLPLGAVVLLRAVVYDAWRHLFFVYPAFVLIAIAGVRKTWMWFDVALSVRTAGLAKGIGATLIALNFASVSWFMIANHPYQNVYFNRLAGPDLPTVKNRFELDYWGLSYRRALEHVVRNNPEGPIKIYRGDSLLVINRWILFPADEARIQAVGFDEAEYVFTSFRQRREGYPGLTEYFSVKVDGAEIMCVYRKQPSVK